MIPSSSYLALFPSRGRRACHIPARAPFFLLVDATVPSQRRYSPILSLCMCVFCSVRVFRRGAGLESVRSLHAKSLLPREAAPITDRLRPGMDFGEFTEATFSAYY